MKWMKWTVNQIPLQMKNYELSLYEEYKICEIVFCWLHLTYLPLRLGLASYIPK